LPETLQAKYLMRESLGEIGRHPTVLLHSLVNNLIAFLKSVPTLIPGRHELPGVIKAIVALLMVPGLVLAGRRMRMAERLFWLAILASTSLSAAIIFADDGWRALYVTHVFLGCL